MICIDAGNTMAEYDCDVNPQNLTLARAFVLRGRHRHCSHEECQVWLSSAGFIEDRHERPDIISSPPYDDGGEPLAA